MTLLFLAGVLFQICNPKSTLPTDQIGEDAAPSVWVHITLRIRVVLNVWRTAAELLVDESLSILFLRHCFYLGKKIGPLIIGAMLLQKFYHVFQIR